jgi:hypothetical protein
VGVDLVNWIVDASIYAIALHHGVVAFIDPPRSLRRPCAGGAEGGLVFVVGDGAPTDADRLCSTVFDCGCLGWLVGWVCCCFC